MPTKQEADELLNYTTRSWTDSYNGTGRIGLIVYKKKTYGTYSLWDTHIFLKGSQYQANYTLFKWSNQLWTSSLQKQTQNAHFFYVVVQGSNPTGIISTDASRIRKLGIRPVQSPANGNSGSQSGGRP